MSLTWTEALRRGRPLSALGGAPAPAATGAATPLSSGLDAATPTTVRAPTVSARTFGATGDGVTDDTDALEAALDALPRPTLADGVYRGGGGVLLLPSGTYRIRRPLRLRDNQVLRGEGHAPNTTLDQGATLIDAGEVDQAIYAEDAARVGVEDLAIKGARDTGISFRRVLHAAVRRVSVFGVGRVGIHLHDGSLFGTVEECNVNGLVGRLDGAGSDLCVGLLVEAESNECSVVRGNLRQNATNIRIIDSNGVLILGVNAEGGSHTLGIHNLGGEITCIRTRFEGVGRAVLLESGPHGAPVFAGFGNGYHPNTGVGIQVEDPGSLLALVEPMLHRCVRAFAGTHATRLGPYTFHDPSRQGLSVGSLRLNHLDEGGVNGIHAGSGRLVLEPAGGNPLELRTPAGAVQWLAYFGDPNAADNALRALLDLAPLGSLYSRLEAEAGVSRLWVKVGAGQWTALDGGALPGFAEPASIATPVVETVAPTVVSDGRINPRNAPYFAVGDGITDDAPAIQAALDAARAQLRQGRAARIVLPAGSYLVRSPLRLDAAGGDAWSLHGEPGTSIVYGGPAGEALLTIADGTRYTVQDLELSGGGLARAALELTGSGRFGSFLRCRFHTVESTEGAAAVALFRPDQADGYQQDLRFEHCTLWSRSAVADGFRVRHTNCGRLVFEGCLFQENATGVALLHNLGVALRSCSFTGAGTAVRAHDTQLVMDACTAYTPRLLWQSMGSATLSGCTWSPGTLPDDGLFAWCDGRLALIGCELLNQSHVGAPTQYIAIGQHAAVFSRGSRYTDARSVPLIYYGQVVGGPEGTDDAFKGHTSWDWGRGPAIDVAGDIGVSYTGDWTAMPSLQLPTPHLIGDSLPIQANQVSTGHRVLSEGQLSRQLARFLVPAAVWTAAATAQVHVLARPFHRTRIVGAWIDLRTPLAGLSAPRLSLGLEGVGDCDTLLRAGAADTAGLIGASIQDLGRGLDPETAVQGGYLVGWTRGSQERLALRLTASDALGDGSRTRLSAGEVEVIVLFEVL